MVVDHDAISRVFGADGEERLKNVALVLDLKEDSDLADVPGLICLAYERSTTAGCSMGDAMALLLDEWESAQAGS